MSTTDELRKMLDKRGVEWQAPTSFDGTARYDTTAGGYWFHEFNGKMTIHGLTPEQAIAATLGESMTDTEKAALERRIDELCAEVEYNHQTSRSRLERIDQLKAENDKLRELVRHMYVCTCHIDIDVGYRCDWCEYDNTEGKCDFERRLRELGVEVPE